MRQVNRPTPKPFNQSETWNGMNLSMIMSQLLRLVGDHDNDDAFGRAMGAPMGELAPMINRHKKSAALAVLQSVGLTAADFLAIVDARVDPKQAFFTFGPALAPIYAEQGDCFQYN